MREICAPGWRERCNAWGLHALGMCTAQTLAVQTACPIACAHTSPLPRVLNGRQRSRRCRGAEALQGEKGELIACSFLPFRFCSSLLFTGGRTRSVRDCDNMKLCHR